MALRRSTFWGSLGDIVISLVMIAFCFITLYPFLYCLAYSLSDSQMAMMKNITIIPVGITLSNYRSVLRNTLILNSFFISVLRTVSAILYTLVITGLAAYAVTKKTLPGKRLLTLILIIPMYISGGLLPYYVLISRLHLFNTFLVYILPHGFWAFNMLIMRTYFESLPDSLEESAKLDGAGDLRILLKIIVPLSQPIVATIAMFVGVWHWNSWFDVMLFVNSQKLFPMQSILQRLLLEAFSAELTAQAYSFGSRPVSPESVKMATLIVSVVPIICIYPFFQRYFIKGIMIGAVKA